MPKYAVTHPAGASQYRAIAFADQVRHWNPGQTRELELSEEVAAKLRAKGFLVAEVLPPALAVEEPVVKKKGR